MKKCISKKIYLVLCISFMSVCCGLSQKSLNFKEEFKSKSRYTFDTSDMIYFSESRSSVVSNACNGQQFRVRDAEVILFLQDTELTAFNLYGSSTGSQPRTITGIQISNERKGKYIPVDFSVDSSINAQNHGCGVIRVTGVKIPAQTYIKIMFGQNVNISEIELNPED